MTIRSTIWDGGALNAVQDRFAMAKIHEGAFVAWTVRFFQTALDLGQHHARDIR